MDKITLAVKRVSMKEDMWELHIDGELYATGSGQFIREQAKYWTEAWLYDLDVYDNPALQVV